MKTLPEIQKEARICTLSSYHQFLDGILQEAYNLGAYEANLKGAIARSKRTATHQQQELAEDPKPVPGVYFEEQFNYGRI